MNGAAVALRDLTLAYRRRPAVHHISGRFAQGSLTAVVGPNGAGKTTLLKAIAGRLAPDAGAIEIEGASRAQIAFMPQLAAIDRSVPIAVVDVLALGWWRHAGAARAIGGGFADAAAAAIETVGLGGFERRLVKTLSAGQLQRLLFARVLVQDATLIILDEPFNAMDARTVDDLVRLLARWHGEGRTVVCVLHDLELVRAHFPRALLLARECVAWGPTGEALQPANLLRARAMVEAWSDGAETCTRGAA